MGTRFSYLQEMQDMLTDSSEDNNGDSTLSSSEDEMESASEGRISSDGDIREADEISIGSSYYQSTLKKKRYYRPHPKDGEGNVFSLSVSSHLGRGVPTYSGLDWGGTYLPRSGRGGGGVPTLRSGWEVGGGTYSGLDWGVPTLAGGGGYLLSGLDWGGTYLPRSGRGVPTLRS